ncbi:MAG TPA: rod shape-determining protein RodA, partial [Rhodanobacteraceae bacterium]|nr:rod shape-determining protein RodA [Rhodanobacteraceae bacterium]
MVATLRARALRFGRHLWRHAGIDLPLAGALFLLACVGLVTLYSASDLDLGVIGGQAARFVLGAILMLVVARIPPTLLRTWTPWFYAFSSFLLVIVVVLGEGRGANRWLDLGVIRFQPSEFLKLSMPMMIAWYLHPRHLPPGWKDIAIVGLLIAIPSVLIAKQPDLGTALLVAASGIFVLFLSGIAWWRVGLMLGAFAGAAPVAWHFLHDYQRQRVLTFLHPENDPLGNGWHIIQSMIAVGSGGVFGKGWHHGTQSRLEFLPEHTTDFIFAVFSEEFGLVGVLLLLALYAFIVGRCLWIAANARDTYSRLLAGAIGMSFFVYVLVNGGMVAGM